jgi:hypothetical protein
VAPAVLGVVAVLAPGGDHRWRARGLLVLGLAVGLAPLLLPAGNGDWGYYEMSPAANLLPSGWETARLRAEHLLLPAEVGNRLFPGVLDLDLATAFWMLGVGLSLVALAADGREGAGRWVVPAMALVFLVAYATSGFPVSQFRRLGPLLNIRYASPWIALLLATVAAGAGAWLSRAGARRWIGAVVVGLVLGPAVAGHFQALRTATPSDEVWSVPAVHHHRFAWIATWRLGDDRLDAASADDPATEAGLRRMRGYRMAAQVHEGKLDRDEAIAALDALPAGSRPAIAAFAQAVTDPVQGWLRIESSNERLATMPADRAALLGRGMAWNLLFGVSSGAPPLPGTRPLPPNGGDRVALAHDRGEELVARARARLAPDAPCWTCASVGPALVDVCRSTPIPEAVGTCLGNALRGLGDAEEVALGAGVACIRPGESPRWCERVAAALDAAGGPVDAFRRGLADPMAGVDRPFILLQVGRNPEMLPGGRSRPGRGGAGPR